MIAELIDYLLYGPQAAQTVCIDPGRLREHEAFTARQALGQVVADSAEMRRRAFWHYCERKTESRGEPGHVLPMRRRER